jgi:enamine deaminase RidA (YjgF/YER057c/UK114 family)
MTEFAPNEMFPTVIRLGNAIYVGCQSTDDGPSIEEQTAQVFEKLVATLATSGAQMSDVVNLRTYYVYTGHDGPEVTEYWNRMTAVRLRYLAALGPAATAVRVLGVPGGANLIGVDAIATLAADRERLMPEHAWDWTIPTPFSQGWRTGNTITVGGQIAADRRGRALAPTDVAEQTRITLEYIRHVLLAAGQGWEHVLAMRICYKHDAIRTDGESHLKTILQAIRETLPEACPAITAFGVDLLYEGLLLEIDAVARRADKQAIAPAGAQDWIGFDGFPPAQNCEGELHIGGISAPGGASLQAQTEATLDRLLAVLDASGYARNTLVKITLFYIPDSSPERAFADRELIMGLARRYLPDAGPVVTLISVPSLPHVGQRFQLDGLAIEHARRVPPFNHRGTHT